MRGAVVGRDAELASISEFIAGVSDGPAVLVLEGEAGMGKTTLWDAGVDDARSRGLLVLEARPVVSETALSYSGIGDLFDRLLDDALAPLPAGQRRALSRALVLDDDEGPPPDAHAVGVAFLNALRALAEEAPLVLAIDDVQWLDHASSAALAYAARRLRDEHVGVLLSRRSGNESTVVDELLRAPQARVWDIEVGPLDLDDLKRVLQAQSGVVLPRPLLAEVTEASGGNPFYALEIVRTLQRTGVSVEAGHPLPVPDSLHELVHGRLLALPAESREFLAAAAAYAHPTIATTESASGVDRDTGLGPALDGAIIELDGDRIRFTHPLLAAGAYEIADRRHRRGIHARLAAVLEDPEARAWQLCASVERPDEEVAAVLEDAARHARARGAPRAAALLLDRSRDLTPGDGSGDGLRRALDAAYLHFESGDSRRAETQLRAVIEPLPPGPERARALVVLARIRLYDAPDDAFELFTQVLQEAGDDDRPTLALAHEGAAASSLWMFERFREAVGHTDVALALADELGDDAFAADVLMNRVAIDTILGRATAVATAERALALQESAGDRRVLDQPLVGLAECWLWIDEHSRAREALDLLMRRADELGDENARPWLLLLLGRLERAVGNLASALGRAREAQDAAEQSGQPLFSAIGLALESVVEAELGHVERAREVARRSLEIGASKFECIIASEALGQLELALGSADGAVRELAPWVGFARDEGIVEPGVIRFVVDHVEALIELGRGDEAAELLDWYEGNASRLRRVSALASCARCRGLIAAQAGALDQADSSFRQALAFHAEVELPLDRARTLLALGATQRRAKRRREARETLEEALAAFDRIGAALWAERTRAELRRISGRAPTAGALTPAEERVAVLVAEGKTNREVAAALYLSERTIEGHLARTFGKLSISQRSELAHALAARQTQGSTASNTGDSPVSADPAAP